MVAPKDDMVISNTNVISDTAGPAIGEHTVEFARTPKMSTYLVAFLVGDFKCVEGSSDGVPIRACATPEQGEVREFRADVGGVHPALLRQLFRNQVSDAQAGHDRHS